jgi:hypothetical protein
MQVAYLKPTTAQVTMDDGGVLKVPVPEAMLIVMPSGVATILPGEEVRIVLDVDGNKLSNPRAVPKLGKGDQGLSFKLTQVARSRATMRNITSTLARTLKFDAGMMPPQEDRVRKTSSCPVRAGQQSFEQWPHPVVQLFAARFRTLPEGASLKCE